MDFNAWLVDVTGEIDGFMYTYILLILLVAVGVYFTIRTKGVQIRFIKDMFKQLTEKKHVQGERSISSFQALMVSTASRVGTGNIAGVATAIATGGPGAVFWMWLMALVGAASAFVESTLAQIWKVRGTDGEFRGGPAYYIHQALGSRKLGVLFSVLLILCFAFGFNGLQAFNACSALEYYIPDYATNGVAVAAGLGLVVFTAGVIFGGSKRISVDHVHHRAGHGHRLHRHRAVDHHRQHHLAARRVRPDVRERLRLPVHLRRLRRLGGHARHQARPVLQRGRHGLGA